MLLAPTGTGKEDYGRTGHLEIHVTGEEADNWDYGRTGHLEIYVNPLNLLLLDYGRTGHLEKSGVDYDKN